MFGKEKKIRRRITLYAREECYIELNQISMSVAQFFCLTPRKRRVTVSYSFDIASAINVQQNTRQTVGFNIIRCHSYSEPNPATREGARWGGRAGAVGTA